MDLLNKLKLRLVLSKIYTDCVPLGLKARQILLISRSRGWEAGTEIDRPTSYCRLTRLPKAQALVKMALIQARFIFIRVKMLFFYLGGISLVWKPFYWLTFTSNTLSTCNLKQSLCFLKFVFTNVLIWNYQVLNDSSFWKVVLPIANKKLFLLSKHWSFVERSCH